MAKFREGFEQALMEKTLLLRATVDPKHPANAVAGKILAALGEATPKGQTPFGVLAKYLGVANAGALNGTREPFAAKWDAMKIAKLASERAPWLGKPEAIQAALDGFRWLEARDATIRRGLERDYADRSAPLGAGNKLSRTADDYANAKTREEREVPQGGLDSSPWRQKEIGIARGRRTAVARAVDRGRFEESQRPHMKPIEPGRGSRRRSLSAAYDAYVGEQHDSFGVQPGEVVPEPVEVEPTAPEGGTEE